MSDLIETSEVFNTIIEKDGSVKICVRSVVTRDGIPIWQQDEVRDAKKEDASRLPENASAVVSKLA